MSKHKYYFNIEKLHFEKITVPLRKRIIKFLSLFGSSIAMTGILLFLAYNFLDSPKERALKREIEMYEKQMMIINQKLKQISVVLEDIQQRDDNLYRLILEAEPIPLNIRKSGYGGADKYAKLEGYTNSELLIEVMKKIDKISKQLYIQSKSFDEVFMLAKNKSQMFSSIPAILPISPKVSEIVSGFGYRIHPVYKTLRMHTGIDFSAKVGTPVYATGDGIVMKPGEYFSGYGICVLINHGWGYETLYGHLSRAVVKPGQKVKRGQLIGYVGNTGLSVAPHLHYEVIKNGKKINPVNFFYNDLTPEEYRDVLEKASRVTQALS